MYLQCFIHVISTISHHCLGTNIPGDSYLEPIFKLQETFCSPSLPIFKKLKLKLLRHQDIFQLRLSTFVYESITKKKPSCFHDYFSFNANIHQHSTRQSNSGNLFLTHRNSCRYGLKSIRYMGAKMWNDLPVEIRDSPSKHKNNLKIFLQINIVIDEGFTMFI